MLNWAVLFTLSFFSSNLLFANTDADALPQPSEKKRSKLIEFKGDGSGLFSNLTRVMEWAYCVKQNENYSLYINLHGLYEYTDNLFSILFKESDDPQISATASNRRIAFSKQQYPRFFSGFKKYATDDMLHFANDKYVYCSSAIYTDPDFALFRNRLHPIIKTFFQPLPDLQTRIDEVARKMDPPLLDDSVEAGQENLKIGIHVRCRQHYRGYTHSPEQFLDDIEKDVDQIMASKNPQTTRIFLATLVQPLVDRLSAKYNVITCDIPRSKDTFFDWVKTPNASGPDGARDAVVDTWCLASCDELWCTSSNMTIFAACLNPHLQIHLLPSLKDYDGW